MDYTLNIGGRLLSLQQPVVMGIVNATPDSFYADSRTQSEQQIAERIRRMVSEGATIIDVGACSTRPGSSPVSEEEEMERLRLALGCCSALNDGAQGCTAVLSVDTFRSSVARMAVEEFGVGIVNDISGAADPMMMRNVAALGVPYVLTSQMPDLRQTLLFFAEKVQQLRDMGQKDIILDPGFGFGKTVQQNFSLLSQMEKLLVMELPLLVGFSRKSMIYKTLGCTPQEALNGTTVLNTIALMKGASILRVHDVREASECIALSQFSTLNS